MNKEQIKKKKAITRMGIFFIFIAFFIVNCRNSFELPLAKTPKTETGTLTLVIGGQGTGRTILPLTILDDFIYFKLDFIAQSEGNSNFSRTWANSSGTIDLNAGVWDLFVTAYLGSNEEPLEAAKGRLEGISVSSGNVESGAIPLYPILTGRGIFRWNISYPENVTGASMEITRVNEETNFYQEIFYFTGETAIGKSGSLELDAGQYSLAVTLSSGEEEMILNESLHIYHNMESVFTETFAEDLFPVSLLHYILFTWNFTDAGIAARHFSYLGINNINNNNFDAVVNWFNILCQPDSIPNDLDSLKVLTDAALIGKTSDDAEFTNANNYTYQGEAENAINALAANGTALTFDWKTDNKTVTVHAGGFTVDLIFGAALPVHPPLTGTVSISGTAQVEQVLTADIANLNGVGDISYQWKRDGITVIGTDSDTYTVQVADAGSTITVTVSRSHNSGSITSDPTATVILLPITGTVTISGQPYVGMELTADTANLGGNGAISYLWQRGATEVGTGSVYTVQAADAGFTITVTVSRSDKAGSVESDYIGPITFPPLTGTVSISGTAQVGQTLTANTTSLGGTGDITYQWQRGETTIGTNSNTYIIQDTDVDSAISVTVTRNQNTGSITSLPTAAIIYPPLTGTVSITGTAQGGQTLSADIANLGGSGTISYQWERNGTGIGTTNTHTVLTADEGYAITVTVTRTNNSGSITSAPTASVLPPPPGTIWIIGLPYLGETLTVDTSVLGGSGDISYQWRRGGTIISSNASYTMVLADLNATITVTVNRSGISGATTSAPIGPVTHPPLGGTVSISGNPWLGQSLSVDAGSLGGSGIITFQWARGGSIVIGTNSGAYTTVAADLGSTISVTVIRSDNTGSVTSAPIGPITLPPIPGTVSISGTAWVGGTLSANPSDLGVSGQIFYQWTHGTNVIGSGSTYTVQDSDIGSAIKVIVTHSGYMDSLESPPTDIIPLPSVHIEGLTQTGETLTAITGNLGGTLSYQWKRGNTNIGSNSSTYTLQAADAGSTITVTVTNPGGVYASDPTITVTHPPHNGIGDPTTKLYLNGNLLENGGTTTFTQVSELFTVTITPGTYTEIIWYLNGRIAAQGPSRTSITLSRQTPGAFQLTVRATPVGGSANSGSHNFVIKN